MATLACLAPPANGAPAKGKEPVPSTGTARILWVSDNVLPDGGFGGPVSGFNEAGWMTLLQNAGYTVESYNPANTGQIPAADIDVINSYDLIVLGRSVETPKLSGLNAPLWNTAITKPLITISAHAVRTNRLGWMSGATMIDGTPTPITAVDLTDRTTAYLFGGISMNGSTTAEPYDEAIDRNTSHIVEPPVAGGNVLATATFTGSGGTTNVTVIAEFLAGAVVRGGADVLGGYRLYFAAGSREIGTPPGVSAAGWENLTPTGESMFLRAVAVALANRNGQNPAQRAQAMISRADEQRNALRNSLLFGFVSALDSFTYDGVTKTISAWYIDVRDGITAARLLATAADYGQAKATAELAKNIADTINNACGFTIGYWTHHGQRSGIKVLLVRDGNHHNEWPEDTDYVFGLLRGLGYSVDLVEEATLLATPAFPDVLKQYNVVWLSNPGYNYDDFETLDALMAAMDAGVGIVLQSDDALYSSLLNYPALQSIETISGMTPSPYDPNGTDYADGNSRGFFEVTVGVGHPVQTGLWGVSFQYGDDIDTSTSNGAAVLAAATPVPTDYPNTAKPVIAAYENPNTGGRSVTILLTLRELEIYNPSLDRSFDETLCDNAVIWASR
ncbi:MAG: hypothetical protein HZA90_22890 [Verrucomicrobia bacterium]|nr:hypothetical protein [Verrucomicrobiota bacterium]